MRFQVKQKIFSFGDKFTIKDENMKDFFQVNGKVFSLGDKLTILDMMGNELFYIEQKLFRLFAEYTIYKLDCPVATIKQKFSLFGSKFDIISDYGSYTIVGRPLNYNFEVYNNNKLIATVSKQFFSLSDTYGVDIDDQEDYGFILGLVIIIDQVVHDNNRNNH